MKRTLVYGAATAVVLSLGSVTGLTSCAKPEEPAVETLYGVPANDSDDTILEALYGVPVDEDGPIEDLYGPPVTVD